MNSIPSTSQGESSQENISFIKDIQKMMFGLGDCSNPLLSTAALVEEVVLQQLGMIIGQADEVSERRGADGIYPQDILFLMRKDVAKLKRMINYISLKEVKRSICNITTGVINSEDVTDKKALNLESKRRVICEEFLQSLGIELGSSDDILMQERLLRLDQNLQTMSIEEYYQYHQARRTSFIGSPISITRFLEWILQSCPDVGSALSRLKSFSSDLLVYLAKETIALLIDMVLVLRRGANAPPTNYLSRDVPPPIADTMYPNKIIELPTAITCSEVREVLRRYYSPQLSSSSLFTCFADPAIFNKILTC